MTCSTACRAKRRGKLAKKRRQADVAGAREDERRRQQRRRAKRRKASKATESAEMSRAGLHAQAVDIEKVVAGIVDKALGLSRTGLLSEVTRVLRDSPVFRGQP
jgi:hypothetical protein